MPNLHHCHHKRASEPWPIIICGKKWTFNYFIFLHISSQCFTRNKREGGETFHSTSHLFCRRLPAHVELSPKSHSLNLSIVLEREKWEGKHISRGTIRAQQSSSSSSSSGPTTKNPQQHATQNRWVSFFFFLSFFSVLKTCAPADWIKSLRISTEQRMTPVSANARDMIQNFQITLPLTLLLMLFQHKLRKFFAEELSRGVRQLSWGWRRRQTLTRQHTHIPQGKVFLSFFFFLLILLPYKCHFWRNYQLFHFHINPSIWARRETILIIAQNIAPRSLENSSFHDWRNLIKISLVYTHTTHAFTWPRRESGLIARVLVEPTTAFPAAASFWSNSTKQHRSSLSRESQKIFQIFHSYNSWGWCALLHKKKSSSWTIHWLRHNNFVSFKAKCCLVRMDGGGGKRKAATSQH